MTTLRCKLLFHQRAAFITIICFQQPNLCFICEDTAAAATAKVSTHLKREQTLTLISA